MPPRYTVLLPTHNRADVVGYAITSVLDQTEPDFELLVVGDGCTDGTADVVAAFGDPRIRWYDLPKAPNFGYANRNVALREATGELMAFMAHDDLLLPDHLALMAAPFERASVEWAYSRPLWVADDGRIVPFAVDLRVPEQLEVFLDHHNSIPASCVVYRRAVHERVGPWPEEVPSSGDWAMWKRIVGPSHGANLAYVPAPTTLHFRAEWRDDGAWGPPPLREWLALAGTAAWPGALKFAVTDGGSAQAAATVLVSEEWTRNVRAAVPVALDLAAWTGAAGRNQEREAADDTRRSLGEARARIAELEQRLAGAEARAVAAEARVVAAEARAVAAEARAASAAAQSQRSALAVAVGRTLRRVRVALRGNPLFDARWYSRHYRDVVPSEAERHWRRRGYRQGRDPSPHFSVARYLERYPDVRAGGLNALDHFYVFGASEGRSAEGRPTTSS